MTTPRKSATPKATPKTEDVAKKVIDTRNAQAAGAKTSADDIIAEAAKVTAAKTPQEGREGPVGFVNPDQATAGAAAITAAAGSEGLEGSAATGSGTGAALPWGGIPKENKDAAYVDAFNKYDEVYGRQPSDDFTTEQLLRLVAEKQNAGKSEGELGNVNAADPTAGRDNDNGVYSPKPFIIDDEDLAGLRVALFSSTPEDRKKLKDLLAEFDTEPEQPKSSVSEAAQAKPELTDEEKLEAEEADNLRKYGPDYIKAVNSSGMTSLFSARAWGLMSPDKDGWKRKVETPAEIRGLKK